MKKATKWKIIFLGITLLAIVLEVWAAFDNSEETIPWTKLIVSSVPVWITMPLIVLIFVWLFFHFRKFYKKEKEKKKK